MPRLREVRCLSDHFDRALTLTNTPEGGNGGFGWRSVNTVTNATAAWATLTNSQSGEIQGSLDNTNETKRTTMYTNDILSFDIDNIKKFKFRAKVSGIAAATTLVAGLASARNNTIDSVAANAWFRIDGGTNTSLVDVESDDGTRDNDDVNTGLTLSSTYKDFEINFENGKSDVRFFMSNGSGHLQRVCEANTFNMAGYSGGLQPIFEMQETADGAPVITIDKVEIEYNV